MKSKKSTGLHLLGFVLLAAMATGCSGINASKTISPLDFLLPGLLQNAPPSPVAPPGMDTVSLLAQISHVPK